MRIAFLAEDFHTEVLEFLFELYISEYELILYNNCDRYENVDLYKEKYPSLTVKPLDTFIIDLTKNIFEKCYMVSYDNVIVPEMLLQYNEKLIYIAHSKRHVDLFGLHNIKFITLTPSLCIKNGNNYMLPITAGDEKVGGSISRVVCCIGEFSRETKNLELLDCLLSKGFNLHIFTMHNNDFLDEINKIPQITVHIRYNTKKIKETIAKEDISYVLFCPKSTPNHMSGSIAFAYNNNIPIIMPKSYAEYLHIKGGIFYDESNIPQFMDTIQQHMINPSKTYKEIKDFRKKVYQRNLLLGDLIMDKQPDVLTVCSMTNHGAMYVLQNDVIGQKMLKREPHNELILDAIIQEVSDIEYPHIIEVGSHLGAMTLGLCSKIAQARVTCFEPQLHIARLHKNTIILNNLLDRVKIYNNAVGHVCKANVRMASELSPIDSVSVNSAKVNYYDQCIRNFGGLSLGTDGEDVDMITVDSMNFTKVDLLFIDVEGSESLVIIGAIKTILKFRPVVMYEKNWKTINTDTATALGISKDIQEFSIEQWLQSTGYTFEGKIDDTYIWVPKYD